MEKDNIIYLKFKIKHLTRPGKLVFPFVILPLFVFLLIFARAGFEIKNLFKINEHTIWILAIFLFVVITTTFQITKEILVDGEGISFKRMYNRKWKQTKYKQISHFCYYEISMGHGDFDRKLVIFFTKEENNKTEGIRLNFAEIDIYTILSHLYRAGFKVLLEEQYLNIEESDKYIPA